MTQNLRETIVYLYVRKRHVHTGAYTKAVPWRNVGFET